MTTRWRSQSAFGCRRGRPACGSGDNPLALPECIRMPARPGPLVGQGRTCWRSQNAFGCRRGNRAFVKFYKVRTGTQLVPGRRVFSAWRCVQPNRCSAHSNIIKHLLRPLGYPFRCKLASVIPVVFTKVTRARARGYPGYPRIPQDTTPGYPQDTTGYHPGEHGPCLCISHGAFGQRDQYITRYHPNMHPGDHRISPQDITGYQAMIPPRIPQDTTPGYSRDSTGYKPGMHGPLVDRQTARWRSQSAFGCRRGRPACGPGDNPLALPGCIRMPARAAHLRVEGHLPRLTG